MIRVALIGVGNCASSLVQGVTSYARESSRDDDRVPGLMHVKVGPYAIHDIVFSAAFDVNRAKIGLDLAEAIFAEPNNTIRFTNVSPTGIVVQPGSLLDGIGTIAQERIGLNGHQGTFAHVVNVLRETKTDVVVNYLPVGSEIATRFYAQAALDAGCAFVNSIPVFLTRDPTYAAAYTAAGLPLIGDDIKSQMGATIVHRMLAHLFATRGVQLDRTYQLNVGGNMDFYNMLERDRLASKRTSKADAVTAEIPYPLAPEDVHIGPSDFVPWLTDRKVAFIRCDGTAFGGVPLRIDMQMEVWDSPNSAGVVIDAVRCAKLALDRGDGGPITDVCAWLFKSPPVQYTDEEAYQRLQQYITSVTEASTP